MALPAQAGKLLYWRFESTSNRLVFTTDNRVQPTAQLIPNPTRVVIDLPGIALGRPSVTQAIGGTIQNIRVGQFDSQTTRLVIELAPGYVVDPQQIKIRGISPTQWTVDLPTPQRLPQNQLPPSTSPPLPQSRVLPPLPDALSADPSSPADDAVQVTRNGFYIPLDRTGNNSAIKKKRTNNKGLELTLPGAVLPTNTANRSLALNQYGVGEIQFAQTRTSPPEAKITLQLAKDSPEWDALYSRMGGLVLLPRGGIAQFEKIKPPTAVVRASSLPPSQSQNATISSVELTSGDRQLLVRGDRPIQGQGGWNRQLGVYEIRIANAQLANPVRGPQLGKNSPIYKLRIRQENATTVVLLVQPSSGVQLGNLTRPSTSQIALDILPARAQATVPRSIDVPPPLNNTRNPPAFSSNPSNAPYNPPRTGILVVIDPGHGGKDPGAIGLGGMQEKDIILPISLEVASFLEQKGIRVLLTRNSDYFVSLQGRTDMANQAQANLFVSIHANSMGKGRPDVNGLEVYYYGNSGLAKAIHRSILRTVDIRDRNIRSARFYVLRHSKMPSTLVEVGFVTGGEDAARLGSPSYRSQMAQAIGRGILEYIQQNGM